MAEGYLIVSPTGDNNRGKKFVFKTGAITGTGSIVFGELASVDEAMIVVKDGALTIPSESANISSISGTTVNIVVIEHQATANIISASAKNVTVYAIGTRA